MSHKKFHIIFLAVTLLIITSLAFLSADINIEIAKAETSSCVPIAGVLNVKSCGVVGDGVADDGPALSNAFVIGNGGTVYLPAGTYRVNNSAQALTVTGFSGTVQGDSGQTKISCTDLTHDCLKFVSANNMVLTNMEIQYGAAPTVRGAPQLLTIDLSQGVTVQGIEIDHGNSSGLFINRSSNINLQDIVVHDMLANGLFLTNTQHVHANNITSHDNQDAAFEVSFYDQFDAYPCQDIQVQNLNSKNDFSGLLVNSCQNVNVAHFNIDTTYGDAVLVIQDKGTTLTQFPDNVQITSGVITNAGKLHNNPTAAGIRLYADTTSPSPMNIAFSSISITDTQFDGVNLDETLAAQMNVTLNNITVLNSIAGVGFRLGGRQVIAQDLYTKNTGYFAFYLPSVKNFSGTHLVACNVDSQSEDTRAVVITMNNPVSIDNMTLMDNRTSDKTIVDDWFSANHSITNAVRLNTTTAINSNSPDLNFCFTPAPTPPPIIPPSSPLPPPTPPASGGGSSFFSPPPSSSPSVYPIPPLSSGPNISLSSSSANVGNNINVSWSNITTPTNVDWIGMFATNSLDGSTNGKYFYTSSCSVTRKTNILSSGTCSFKIPTVAPGTYEFRFFTNDTYTRIAKSSTFIITNKTPYDFGTITLRNGSRGEAVKELQRFLNDTLNLGLIIDGKLGPKTIAVIKTWQKSKGLVPDGLIGPKTKAMMNGER